MRISGRGVGEAGHAVGHPELTDHGRWKAATQATSPQLFDRDQAMLRSGNSGNEEVAVWG